MITKPLNGSHLTIYTVVNDYVDIQCPINLTLSSSLEYNWTTPQEQSGGGCSVYHTPPVTLNDQGFYNCTVRDKKLRNYEAPESLSTTLPTYVVVLQGMKLSIA